MKPFLPPALALLLAAACAAQGQTAPPGGPYLTAASSDAWMATVRQLPRRQQLAAVRARVLGDTLGQPYHLTPCYTFARAAAASATSTLAPTEPARVKGITLLYIVNGAPFYNNSAAEAAKMRWLLTPKSGLPKKIEFWPSTAPRLVAFYGTRAAGGAVLLTLKL